MPQLRYFLLLSATRYNREMAMPFVIPKPRSGESGCRARFSLPNKPHRGGPLSILYSLNVRSKDMFYPWVHPSFKDRYYTANILALICSLFSGE